MNNPILVFLTVMQIAAAIFYLKTGQWQLGGTFLCYSVANVFILLLPYQK